MVPAGQNPAISHTAAYNLLYKHKLGVELHTVPTCVWLFTDCVLALFRFALLGIPDSIFSLAINAQHDKQKRIVLVREFFANPDAIQNLKRATSCLQVNSLVLNLTVKTPKLGQEPVLVTLGRGAAQNAATAKVNLFCLFRSQTPCSSDETSLQFHQRTSASIAICRQSDSRCSHESQCKVRGALQK